MSLNLIIYLVGCFISSIILAVSYIRTPAYDRCDDKAAIFLFVIGVLSSWCLPILILMDSFIEVIKFLMNKFLK